MLVVLKSIMVGESSHFLSRFWGQSMTDADKSGFLPIVLSVQVQALETSLTFFYFSWLWPQMLLGAYKCTVTWLPSLVT